MMHKYTLIIKKLMPGADRALIEKRWMQEAEEAPHYGELKSVEVGESIAYLRIETDCEITALAMDRVVYEGML